MKLRLKLGAAFQACNSHTLKLTAGDEPHAIHGVGWQRAWRVLEAGVDFARLSYEHQPDETWPFAFVAVQTFRLTTNELVLTLHVENTGGAK